MRRNVRFDTGNSQGDEHIGFREGCRRMAGRMYREREEREKSKREVGRGRKS